MSYFFDVAIQAIKLYLSQNGYLRSSSGSLTPNGVVVGSSADSLASTAAMTDGQLLVGQTAGDPAPKTIGGDATVAPDGTLSLSATGVADATYGDGTHVGQFTVDDRGRITGAANVAITGVSPVGSALTSGYIFVGNVSNLVAAVPMSGDATIDNAGALTLANSSAARSHLGLGSAATHDTTDFDAAGAAAAALATAESYTDSSLAAFVGTTNIVTLGTVTTGTWHGTAIAAAYLGAHASTHQNGGSDEVATATAAANAIPKAGAGGTLAIGWIPTGSTSSTVCIGNDSRLSDARTPVGTALTSASIWVGNASNVAAAVAVTGDVTITNAGVTAIGGNKVTAAKMAASATDVLFGRSTAGAGAGEEIACTAAGRALIDDASASAQRDTLGASSGIWPSSIGGTGNGFTKFSGPAASEKTKTLSNANDTIAELGQAQTFTKAQKVLVTNPGTNTVSTLLTLAVAPTGIAAAGLGVLLPFNIYTDAGNEVTAGSIQTKWLVAADGSESAQMDLIVRGSGASASCVSIAKAGATAKIGFLGAAVSAALASPDLGTLATTFGLATGTPTFGVANLTGSTFPASILGANQGWTTQQFFDGGIRSRQSGSTRYRSDLLVTGGTAGLNAYDDTGGVYIPLVVTVSTFTLNLGTAGGTTGVVGTSAGKIGIGGTPSYKAHVLDSVTDFTFCVDNTNGGNTGYGMFVRAGNNAGGAVGAYFYACYTPNTTLIGGCRQTSGSSVNWDTTSDERLKTNVRETSYGLDDLMELSAVDFEWRNCPGTSVTGFLGQQAHRIFPDAVTPGGEDVAIDPWTMDYGRLSPLIVKALQDLARIVERQAEQIARLQRPWWKRLWG